MTRSSWCGAPIWRCTAPSSSGQAATRCSSHTKNISLTDSDSAIDHVTNARHPHPRYDRANHLVETVLAVSAGGVGNDGKRDSTGARWHSRGGRALRPDRKLL